MRETEQSETHESYGLLQIHSQHGGKHSLFGSYIKHDTTICISLYKARIIRDYNQDRYSWEDIIPLFEITMSPTQFAEAITNLNQGCGIPCTISEINGKHFEPPPFKKEQETVHSEFKEKCKEVSDRICIDQKVVKGILDKKTPLNKEEKNYIMGVFEKINREVACNMPFVHEQFQETCEKTTALAKSEIDALITHNKLASNETLEQAILIERKNTDE